MLLNQPEAELRYVGDDEKSDKEDKDEWKCRGSDLADAFLKPEARHEEVHSDRRHKVCDFEIGEKNNS